MPGTLKMLTAAADKDWDTLSDLLGGVYFADNWSHFPESFAFVRDHIQEHPDALGWFNYFIIYGKDARIAGNCGYKGKPSLEGTVEIGYEIADQYQNRGFATEAVDALLQHAFKHPEVTAVLAHTLPEENASCQVLRHHNFEWEGAVLDETDGLIWRWSKKRDQAV